MLNWRTLIRQQTYDQLVLWLAADPTLAASVHRVRPQSFSAAPLVYVGALRTESESTSGVMRSQGEVEVVAVAGVIDSAESIDRVDAMVDSLHKWFGARAHYVDANTVAEPISSEPIDLTVGDAAYTATMLTIGRIVWAEGRDT